MKNKKKPLLTALSWLAALAVWQICSMIADNKIIFASPIDTIKKIFEMLFTFDLWETAFFSLSRIALGFLTALLIGSALAFLAGKYKFISFLLKPYMTTIKSVPVASFIILALLWITASELSVFIAFLMVLPIIYTNVYEGIISSDIKMLQLSEVFKVSEWKQIIMIRLPHIRPFLISGCKVALGLSWKAGIAAEVIGIVSGSIGEKLYYAKIYIDSVELFAWTLIIVVLSIVFEKLMLLIINLIFDGAKHLC